MLSLMLVVMLALVGGGLALDLFISQGFVVGGILFFLTYIGSSLPFLEPLLIMMGSMGLLLIQWSGLLVHCPREGRLLMLSVTWLCFLDLLLFGLVSGLLVLLLLLVLMMLHGDLTHLVFWLSGFLFLVLYIGLLGGWTLVLVVFLMLSCSFSMNFGLERDWSSRRLILGIFGMGVQFQCRLFLLVQALIFGVPVVLLVQ